MKNPLRHAFRGSKINRDRRDDAFAKAIIGIAERRRLDPACRCTSVNDPACPTHGIAASNARQNAYWQRVGGHPDAGEVDHEIDAEACDHCGKLTCLGDCPQYFENMQDQMETQDDDGE